MRTYDKLIAAIFARRAKGGLRPFPGGVLAWEVMDTRAAMQDM